MERLYHLLIEQLVLFTTWNPYQLALTIGFLRYPCPVLNGRLPSLYFFFPPVYA
jgi:hypothetical protein